jgi:tetratricopeptide (TPR) repeat protein
MRLRNRVWVSSWSVVVALFLVSGPLAYGQGKKVFDHPNDGKITAASEEAYKYYAEGRDLHFKGDYRKSIALMEKAVALDPEFAMAYRSMATAYSNMGYVADAKKFNQKAMDARTKVSEIERYAIEANFYEQDEATLDKAIESYNKIIALDPTSTWQMALGLLYANLEQWDKAISYYEVLRRAGKSSQLNYGNLAAAYMAKGAFDKAREVLEEWRTKYGPSDAISSSLADIHGYQGRLDLALDEVEKARALKPDEYSYVLYKGNIRRLQGNWAEAENLYQKASTMKEPRAQYDAETCLAFLYIEQGRFVKAEEMIKQAIAWADKSKDAGSKAWCQAARGFVLSDMGKYDQALVALEESLKTAIDAKLSGYQRFNLIWKGLLLTNMKALEKAQASAAEFKIQTEKSKDKNEIAGYYDLMARIELGKENYSQAIEYVEKALSFYGFSPLTYSAYTLETKALAHFRSGNLDKAQDVFEKIQALTSGRWNSGDTFVKSYYMLGQIHERKGDKIKAAELYKKFLSLWKDADPGIPEVTDAGKRLAGLKVT